LAINNFIAYEPPSDGWSGGHLKFNQSAQGVFLLVVQRDGSVANVKMIKSLGYDELNLRAVNWLRKW
jgi:hypothetical protein